MSNDKKQSNPHNNIFKRIMSDVEVAKDFMRQFLPKEILKDLDLDYLRI